VHAVCACSVRFCAASSDRIATWTCSSTLEPGRDLFDLIELKHELESMLHRRIDVLTEKGLSPSIRDDVPREARPL